MKELEKAIEQLEKENTKIEKAQNRAKLLNQKINKLKRSAETKRKIEKGGVIEAFEREITGRQGFYKRWILSTNLIFNYQRSHQSKNLKNHREARTKQKQNYRNTRGRNRDREIVPCWQGRAYTP